MPIESTALSAGDPSPQIDQEAVPSTNAVAAGRETSVLAAVFYLIVSHTFVHVLEPSDVVLIANRSSQN